MANCVIFCAGGFDGLAKPIAHNDYIIAADGGLAHTQALGLTPHAVLGDFDSYSGKLPEGIAIERFPVEKDDTDTMLATQFIEGVDNVSNLHLLAVYGSRNTLFKGHGHIFTFIRSLFRSGAEYQ